MISYYNYWLNRHFHYPTKTLSEPTHNIELQYPNHWVKIAGYEYRFGADDGFFQISAIHGRTLKEVVRQEAFHPLEPYGSKPIIEKLVIKGQQARLILPSYDQAREMMNQSAFIVTYPKPIQIAGESYEYFILWADKFHINKIVQSLNFLH